MGETFFILQRLGGTINFAWLPSSKLIINAIATNLPSLKYCAIVTLSPRDDAWFAGEYRGKTALTNVISKNYKN